MAKAHVSQARTPARANAGSAFHARSGLENHRADDHVDALAIIRKRQVDRVEIQMRMVQPRRRSVQAHDQAFARHVGIGGDSAVRLLLAIAGQRFAHGFAGGVAQHVLGDIATDHAVAEIGVVGQRIHQHDGADMLLHLGGVDVGTRRHRALPALGVPIVPQKSERRFDRAWRIKLDEYAGHSR